MELKGLRFAMHNLGCKVNSYEAEAMSEAILKEGATLVPFQEEADIYLINTCSVTNIADRKSRQMIPGKGTKSGCSCDCDRLLCGRKEGGTEKR